MPEEPIEPACRGCGKTADEARLETCSIDHKAFCVDCAHRAGFGRRFCSQECAHAYYFTGETDDDEDAESE
jgi:hypothetical protein